jgi:hypothetical protein
VCSSMRSIAFISILLSPSCLDVFFSRAIVGAVDGLFSEVEKYSFGPNGVISKFSAPVVKTSLSDGLNAGKSSNPIAKTRNAVVGAMRGVIGSYKSTDDSNSLTVADIIAFGLSDVLRKIDVLAGGRNVETTYYEVVNGTIKKYDEYDRKKNITSLMWTIPLGKRTKITVVSLTESSSSHFFA